MSSFLGKVTDKVKNVAATVTDKVKSVAGVEDKTLITTSKCEKLSCDVVHNESKHEFTADVGDSNKAVLSYKIIGQTQPCCAQTCATGLEEKTSAMSVSDKTTFGATSCKQAEILNISVPESARHKGVGTSLIIAFLDWAHSPNQCICDIRIASSTREFIAKNSDDIMKESAGKYDMILSSRKV
jgi:hypothetical protein